MFFKLESFKGYLLHILVILLLTAGVFIWFFNYYLPDYTRHGEELTVPSLKGKSMEEVKAMLDKEGLRYEINDSAYVKGEVPFKVIKHHPSEGAKVKTNRKIYLTVTSRKPTNVPMPDLVNKSYKSARLLLGQVGLEIGDTTIVKDAYPVVLKQSIKGKSVKQGAMVPKYSKVDLIIGDGQHPDGILTDSTTF
jgi:eukaryotic-like serine/threonine-protein kinase